MEFLIIFNDFLPTLMAKTFFILFCSLLLTTTGAMIVIQYFRNAYATKASFVKVKKNKYGETDLIVDSGYIHKIFWPTLIVNIISFIALLIFQSSFPANMFLMGLFTFAEGILLGIILINIDENLAVKVALLTAFATCIAGSIGLYSSIDFSFLGVFLFFALLALLGIQIVRIFVSIQGTSRKLIALFGIVIFIGYLLYDFNNLKKAKSLEYLNNWPTALDTSVSIYLDIINLFLYILDLFSDAR